jgi:hypothetical protein
MPVQFSHAALFRALAACALLTVFSSSSVLLAQEPNDGTPVEYIAVIDDETYTDDAGTSDEVNLLDDRTAITIDGKPYRTTTRRGSCSSPADQAGTGQDGYSDGELTQERSGAGGGGTVAIADANAPFIIGDAASTGYSPVYFNQHNPFTGIGNVTSFRLLDGGNVGQSKLVENFSPMPRDRVYLNYSFFDQVPSGTGAVNINRWTPGFEKTFFNRLASVEIRTPFAGTLDSTIPTSGPVGTSIVQFGNLFLAAKGLLIASDVFALSGGMSMSLPTASDTTVLNTGTGHSGLRNVGQPTSPFSFQRAVIRNQEVRLQPFLAFLATPNDRLFVQGLAQIDTAAGSNGVTAYFVGNQQNGKLGGQTFANLSLSGGYWLYRDNSNFVTGISPIAEAHFTQSLDNGRYTIAGLSSSNDSLSVGIPSYHVHLINVTAGVNIQLGPLSSLLLGYTTPIGSGSDKQFEGEFRLLFNRRFGPQSRLTRAQF